MTLKGRSRAGAVLLGALAIVAAGMAATELHLDEIVGLDGRDWYWLLVVLGGWLGWLGWERAAGTLGAGMVGLVLLIQWLPWPATLARQFIRTDPLPAGPVDAIVVLSASITDEARLNQVAVDRLLEGIRLAKAGVAPRLVVSRVETDIDGTIVSGEQDQRGLIALGLEHAEVHVLSPVGTTRTEALRMGELARARGWTSVVLVTSPTHTRRACGAFEGVGLEVTCRPSPDRAVSWSQLDSPADRTAAVGQWLYESLGWWEYRARGWLPPRP